MHIRWETIPLIWKLIDSSIRGHFLISFSQQGRKLCMHGIAVFFLCFYDADMFIFEKKVAELFVRISWERYLLRCLLFGSYFTYRSYKCYNPQFLDRTVSINIFSFIISKNSIFHVIKKIFWDKTSGKLKKISQTVRIIGPETLQRRLNPALCVLQTYFRISL